uniref:Uncharacterized protein n=1 Tax=Mustela putorius furo TaxID=9669 RepID=M3YZV9_MUSPF
MPSPALLPVVGHPRLRTGRAPPTPPSPPSPPWVRSPGILHLFAESCGLRGVIKSSICVPVYSPVHSQRSVECREQPPQLSLHGLCPGWRDHSKFSATLKSGSDSSTSDHLLKAKAALRPEQPTSGLPSTPSLP